ncbi:transcription factor CRF1-domain-containing protein [Myxozyma melibiosi]|uniref:Transcription factor CRF1-domain-containing protein n=1 Tax=Myxozyma melibiosi TaxID=54550 RepID=A0ABR1FEU9_9ASCO
MLAHSRDYSKKPARKLHSSPKGSASPDFAPSFSMHSKRRQSVHSAATSKRRREGRKQPIVVYNNPYSSDSAESDDLVVVPASMPSNKRSKHSHHHRNNSHHNSNSNNSNGGNSGSNNNSKHFISKRRRNSETNREIDSQLLAFLADANDGTTFEFEFHEEDDDDGDDADDDDDDGVDIEGIVVIQEESDVDDDDDDNDSDEIEEAAVAFAAASDDDEEDEEEEEEDDDDNDDDRSYNDAADLQLADDGLEESERQIEKEEEAAIVEEYSFDQPGDVSTLSAAFTADVSNSELTSDSSDDDEEEDDNTFVESLFVDKSDPALKHIVSSAPHKYHDSDDDSFILDYFFSSGDSSDEDQQGSKNNDDSGRRRIARRRRTNTFSDDVDESEADEENGGFDLLKEDMSSGIDAGIRKNGYVEVDDGESTDEDENLPPPSIHKAGHRATEILMGSTSASKPPVLGSWILPTGRRIGVINGLATRTLSPPPFPRGEDEPADGNRSRMRIARDLPSSPSVMAAAARGVARAFDVSAFGSDSEDQSDLQLEEFIYMSELDEEPDEGDLSSVLESTPGPTSTPVWAGKFNSRFPLSAFRNRSSMQYRST